MEQKRKLSRKRLRTRKRVNWGPVFVVLLLSNLVIACFSSKLTAIRSINLEGVRDSERLRLNKLAGEIKGVPALKVDPRVIEAPFTNESRIKSADFRRNVFGVGRLILVYRKAVASIAGSKQAFIDEDGVVFTDPEEKLPMPSVLLQAKIKVTVVALSGVINYKQIAELAQMVRTTFPETLTGANQIEIEVQESGGVCLNMNSGIAILGTWDLLPEKVEKLKQVLIDQPDMFKNNLSINMMIPSHPQFKQRKKESG